MKRLASILCLVLLASVNAFAQEGSRSIRPNPPQTVLMPGPDGAVVLATAGSTPRGAEWSAELHDNVWFMYRKAIRVWRGQVFTCASGQRAIRWVYDQNYLQVDTRTGPVVLESLNDPCRGERRAYEPATVTVRIDAMDGEANLKVFDTEGGDPWMFDINGELTFTITEEHAFRELVFVLDPCRFGEKAKVLRPRPGGTYTLTFTWTAWDLEGGEGRPTGCARDM